jgi:hypothetical protein
MSDLALVEADTPSGENLEVQRETAKDMKGAS